VDELSLRHRIALGYRADLASADCVHRLITRRFRIQSAWTRADEQGHVWPADTGFSGGDTYSSSNAVRGTRPFQYEFSFPDGGYVVTLKFAEVDYTKPGQRAFKVSVNGKEPLAKFNPLQAAGGPTRPSTDSFI
jgi:hypothetical protein